MNTTFNKAIVAFLTALVGLVAAFGYDAQVNAWATPTNIELAGSVLGAVISGVSTYFVKNKPATPKV